MRTRVVVFIGCLIACMAAAATAARAEARVALVIGNSSYQNAPSLPNPVNDATDMGDALSKLGFDVRTVLNANYDGMRRALLEFGQRARGADFAVVFFAGHGMQLGDENWLIPVDAQLATDVDVPNEAMGLQPIVRAVSNAKRLGLIILDACRNNPFLSKMQSTNVQRSVERGFSRVESAENVLVAYSARDGTTARDGDGRNSPFTQSLLKNIQAPGVDVRFLFARVRDDVMASTGRKQQPFIYQSLPSDPIYLSAAKEDQSGLDPLSGLPRLPEKPSVSPDKPVKLATAHDTDLREITLSGRSPLQGATISNISAALADRFHLDANTDGVVITDTLKDSTAANVGFQKGDIILAINNRKIASTGDLDKVTREQARLWRITLVRGGQQINVTLGG